MAEHEVEKGEWVCSAYNVWVEGVYATRKAARLAYRVSPSILGQAWEAKRGADGIVAGIFTEDEVRDLVRQTRKESGAA